jgi:nucleoside 2-deoxyribosyltransferase
MTHPFIVYLAGPIETCAHDGRQWRRGIAEYLRDLGVLVIDPTEKESPKSIAYLKHQRAIGRLPFVRSEMLNIRHLDLECVRSADLVIAYHNPNTPSVGTVAEIEEASRCHIPIWLFVDDGAMAIPLWYFGVEHVHFFHGTERILQCLTKYLRGGASQQSLDGAEDDPSLQEGDSLDI